MSDLAIIDKLNKLLGFELKRLTSKGVEIEQTGYILDSKNNINHLCIPTCPVSLDKLVDVLKDCIKLESLDIQYSNIKDATPLIHLKSLKTLQLFDNNIKDITPISELTNLERLYIGRNEIQDISSVIKLTKIKVIFLSYNKIKKLPDLRKLRRLERLDLHGNPIEVLPEWITTLGLTIQWSKLWKHGHLSLFDNPLKEPSVEIVKEGNDAIARYFRNITKQGIDYIYEAKLTLVGEGSAGKTSLQVRLLNPKAELPLKDNRTRGIRINDWEFKKTSSSRHTAHIWDFGGQDVYYPVHRFFITESSVFVLLASTRQTHHNFDYWIPTIYQFGGNSPIIIGQTCHDGNKVSWNDIDYYVGNKNFNIIKTQSNPYYELNLPKKNDGLIKIKKVITEQIINLPHYGKGVPSSWVPVREKLAKMQKNNSCISFEMFQSLCRKSDPINFENDVDIEDCAKFLHSVGIILWYYDHTDLRNWVILKPEWAMNAVYKIIDDIDVQKKNGTIQFKDFERLWDESCYYNKHEILKKMLEIFKIAFPKKGNKGEYIIPTRLETMATSNRWSDNEPTLRLEYKFDFMPRGIVNQISAELSRYIKKGKEVWNNAVNFISEDGSTESQVEEDFYNRRISIKAKGKDARGLIMLIMNALRDITDGYKGVSPEIYVPCICPICKTLSKPTTFYYNKLIEWSLLRENATVVCNESNTQLSIEELLYSVGLPNPEQKQQNNSKIKIFVSYSKYDEEYLQEFEDHLSTLKQEKVCTFNCREIEFGKEWDSVIKQQLDESNIIVCLVSSKFLSTDYITKIEIPIAIKNNKTIIPIIIKACDWESSEIGKYQAAQRGKIVSLNNSKKLNGIISAHTKEERDAFWTDIVKELRRKILD